MHDSDSEEDEENLPDSPTSLKSPKSARKAENSADEDAEVDDQEASPDPLEGTENGLKKKLNRTSKHKGELVTIKLRNGDRQTYRKRCKNLMWHCAPLER